VCNQQGSPYLVPLETGFDVGVVFLDPADAEEMMQSMIQVSGIEWGGMMGGEHAWCGGC